MTTESNYLQGRQVLSQWSEKNDQEVYIHLELARNFQQVGPLMDLKIPSL
jgi:hypothetical protein